MCADATSPHVTRRRLAGFAVVGLLTSLLRPEPLPDDLHPGAGSARTGFKDPLDVPAPPTSQGSSSALCAVCNSGGRWIACGVRGLVMVSDDSGRSWQQVGVPVSSDLVALHFPTPLQGWVVGHDGVVLHSADAGNSWAVQLDGRRIEALLREQFERLAARGDEEGTLGLQQLAVDFAHGPEQPLLGVWFEDAKHGFVAGAFGLLLGTDDGGASWQPWTARIDNPDALHLNAVRHIGAGWFIASERGKVFRLANGGSEFRAVETGYAGSFFGLLGNGAQMMAYGLRGTVCHSADGGRHWARSATGLAGSAVSALVLPDGRWLVASSLGQLSLSSDRGATFSALPLGRPFVLAGLAETGEELIAVGPAGVQRMPLP